MIPSCILLCLWTSSTHLSPPSKQSSTNSSQWIIKWHFSRRTKSLHHSPDTLYCHFECAEHRPLSFCKWLLQPGAVGSLTPILQPCNGILQLSCFHLGRSWIILTNLTVKLGLRQKYSTYFWPTQLGILLHITSCWAEVSKSRLKGRLYHLLCTDETIYEKISRGPNSGVVAFHSEASNLGIPRLAREDIHQKNQKHPK